MDRIRRALSETYGKVAAVIFCVGLLILGGYIVVDFWHGDTPDTARYAMYVDSESGKAFRHETTAGETPPIPSPFTGKSTGVRAEACFWTAQGGTKTDATWVALNQTLGKPGATFCPDCGRLVVGHNPEPEPGRKPPPTKDEFARARLAQPSMGTARRDDR